MSKKTDNASEPGREQKSPMRRQLRPVTIAAEEKAARVDLAARLMGLRPSELLPKVEFLASQGLLIEKPEAEFVLPEKVVRELEEEGKIDRNRRWFWPTKAGFRAAYPAFEGEYEPAVGQLRHMAASAATRYEKFRENPDGVWVPERYLRKDAEFNKYRDENGDERHLADALWVFPDKKVAIEVETAWKDRKKVEYAIEELSDLFDEVHYHCVPATRPRLDDLKVKCGFEKLHVFDLDERRYGIPKGKRR
jgi:hypothetical protein